MAGSSEVPHSGDVIVSAGETYIITRVEEDDTTGAIGNVYVKRWVSATNVPIAVAADVAAEPYSVRTAGFRWDFGSTITMLGSLGGDSGGDPAVSSAMQFQPVSEPAIPILTTFNEAGSGW